MFIFTFPRTDNKMYWSDEKLFKIEIYNLMTTNRTVLFQGKASKKARKGKLLFEAILRYETLSRV